VGETSWAFLLVGSFAAVGAAMAVGTLAALLRYRRTGIFPGSEGPEVLPRARLVALWVRVGVGAVLTVLGIIALVRAGLL
jgi:hypothetical protein